MENVENFSYFFSLFFIIYALFFLHFNYPNFRLYPYPRIFRCLLIFLLQLIGKHGTFVTAVVVVVFPKNLLSLALPFPLPSNVCQLRIIQPIFGSYLKGRKNRLNNQPLSRKRIYIYRKKKHSSLTHTQYIDVFLNVFILRSFEWVKRRQIDSGTEYILREFTLYNLLNKKREEEEGEKTTHKQPTNGRKVNIYNDWMQTYEKIWHLHRIFLIFSFFSSP